MLKKVEEMMHLRKRKLALEFLLTHWAGTGIKNELYRAWNTFKPQGDEKMGPSYACMITCLAKLDDIEGAEKIFEEWESQGSTVCDNRVLIDLLIAYYKEGLFEKAESAVNKAPEGGKPHASLWNVLAMGYKRDNQMAKAA
ncbi:hypothetical protein LWI28_009440 [Acer negundo]|uniref:Pentatricopeptide repeat-containing protein n=1 Tax=Acer negundo TaxID=4023 RepID=A0AAD5NR27_ACENE|nr:hypothetical protein LWI28_009440 [Acer negundo]